jgi:tetratricopeptide (TPR) repeat protein
VQSNWRETITLALSLITLVVVPALFLYMIFGDQWKARRKSASADPEARSWQAELSERTAAKQKRFLVFVGALFLLGLPLLFLTPKREVPPANDVMDRPSATAKFWFFSLVLFLPPAILVAVAGVIGYRFLRHYDRGVSRAAKQANSGDLDGAIAELKRQIEAKGLSAARANAMGCLLTMKEDWHEARRMFEEAERLGMAPSLLRANRGVALWKSGDPEAALPLLVRAALDEPFGINIRCHLCQVLADLGRIEEARAQLQSIEDLHKKQHTVPADARRNLEKYIQACRDRLAAKSKRDLAGLDEL